MSAPSQTATQTQSAGSSSAQTLAQLAGAIVAGRIRVVDLTVPLESATPTIQLPPPFAPSKPFSLEEISRYDERGPARSTTALGPSSFVPLTGDAPQSENPHSLARSPPPS